MLAASAVAAPPGGLAQGWQEYSPRERYDALQNYRRHETLPAERQQDIERNYQRWREMPEQERSRIRQNYERYRQLAPDQRQRLKRRYQEQKSGSGEQ
ncbi:MAG: DUF3106 domain-containing protein [Deltaproteobacteria bacterium]|nr:DUF3106 domain-containing protein [Deltaproteobacteria bacterium]